MTPRWIGQPVRSQRAGDNGCSAASDANAELALMGQRLGDGLEVAGFVLHTGLGSVVLPLRFTQVTGIPRAVPPRTSAVSESPT